MSKSREPTATTPHLVWSGRRNRLTFAWWASSDRRPGCTEPEVVSYASYGGRMISQAALDQQQGPESFQPRQCSYGKSGRPVRLEANLRVRENDPITAKSWCLALLAAFPERSLL